MKPTAVFIQKEFFHIFRDKRTMLILLGIPIVLILLLGFAITTEVRNVRVGVLAPTPVGETERLIQRVDAGEYFRVVCRLSSPDEMQQAFRRNEIDVAMVFYPGFHEDVSRDGACLQLVADASEPNMAVTRTGYLAGILAEELSAGTDQTTVVKMMYNPQMKSAYNFVPGVMGLILMLLCAMMTSISIVREKEIGTMELLLVSPVRPLAVVVSKAIPYLALSFINLATILLLAVYVLDIPIAGGLGWILLGSFLFICVALALGLLISSVARTQMVAMLASGMLLMLPTILLSGIIFPIESMPSILQAVSAALPARWYVSLVRKLMIEGVDVIYVWREMLVLAVMAILLLIVSLKLFKDRLE